MEYATPLVKVMTVTCDLRRSGPSTTHHVDRPWIGLPLSGVFTIHARTDEHVIHPALGVVFPPGVEYRMSHPTDDGDTALALGLEPGLAEEAFAARSERVGVTGLDLRMRYAVGLLRAAAWCGTDTLLVETLALDVVRAIAAGVFPDRDRPARAPSRAAVDRVRAILAACPGDRWTLTSLGRLVGYSPFHLAREFRAHTGVTVHRYLVDLRLAAALERIESGDAPLAAVAADLGFSHHSHLTATFRSHLGFTPRAIREALRRSSRVN